jgi:hypothetical protein
MGYYQLAFGAQSFYWGFITPAWLTLSLHLFCRGTITMRPNFPITNQLLDCAASRDPSGANEDMSTRHDIPHA